MTKEQILEKIRYAPNGMGIDELRLASYLATIEERLEDNKTHIHCKVCDWSRRAAGKIEDQLTTPTECEHKHRGLYGECLKCTEKLDDSPTEVKDSTQILQDVIRDFVMPYFEKQLKDHTPTEVKDGCPPHNLIDYHYTGAWGGSTPPPNKKCTKCLIELYF